MRYDDPELRDLLAAHYVLGSLRGAARRRFENLAIKRTDWQQATDWWMGRLHLLADTVPAIEPRKALWQKIQTRLYGPEVASQPGSSWLDKLGWWQGLAFGSSAIAAILAFILVTHQPQTLEAPISVAVAPKPISVPDHISTKVALLANADAKPGWMLALTKNKAGKPEIRVTALASLKPQADKSFELWILPPDKSAPISLGVLPQQGNQQVVVSEQTATLLADSGLAVTLEPVGGSPTGGPTGAVVYQGKLAEI